jgi:hypothetical protein
VAQILQEADTVRFADAAVRMAHHLVEIRIGQNKLIKKKRKFWYDIENKSKINLYLMTIKYYDHGVTKSVSSQLSHL